MLKIQAMKRFSITITIITLALMSTFAQEKNVKVGDYIKDFEALDEQGKKWNSKNLPDDSYLVVYFYPAAMTGGCTKQACAYRDDKSELEDLNALVIGISGDEVNNLELFKKAHNLNFTLLSDPDGRLAELFGVPVNKAEKSIVRTVEGNEYTLKRQATISRWTYIINSEGKVIYKSSEVDAANDSKNVIEVLRNS